DKRMPAAHVENTPGQSPRLCVAVEQLADRALPLEEQPSLAHGQRSQRDPDGILRVSQRRELMPARHEDAGPTAAQSVAERLEEPIPGGILRRILRSSLREQVRLEVVQDQEDPLIPERVDKIVPQRLVARLALEH